MNRLTHILFAIALAVSTGLLADKTRAIYALPIALSSIAPDADLRLLHRKLFHNIFVPLLISVSLLFLPPLLGVNAQLLAVSVLIGWFSHIALDAVTVKGVYPLYPLLNAKVSLGVCKSNDMLWNAVFSATSTTAILFYISKFAFS